jgi:Pyrimidine dimer DNA glycosylase/2-cysteine adaptor domain
MVITFCISSIPEDTFSILDNKRLGKQRIEAQTIIKTLDGQGSGYSVSLPIVRMWEGHVDALKYYFNCCVDEWKKRGYKNTLEKYEVKEDVVFPWWFGNKQIHESMKASLLRKDNEYYSQRISLENNEYINYGYIFTNKLTEEQVESMKNGVVLPLGDICSEFGSGVPAQFRISKATSEEWLKDRSRNPKTGRKIKENGKMYKELLIVAEFHKLI